LFHLRRYHTAGRPLEIIDKSEPQTQKGWERRAFELFVQTSATRDTQSANEFSEINGAALIRIKDVEDLLGKLFWITEGEELFVYLGKLFLVEVACRAVVLEALVPLLEFSLVDWGKLSWVRGICDGILTIGVLLEFCKLLRREFTLRLAHGGESQVGMSLCTALAISFTPDEAVLRSYLVPVGQYLLSLDGRHHLQPRGRVSVATRRIK
jgi:hypothetical protein